MVERSFDYDPAGNTGLVVYNWVDKIMTELTAQWIQEMIVWSCNR